MIFAKFRFGRCSGLTHSLISLALIFCGFLGGCISSSPKFSVKDRTYFHEQPYLAIENCGYTLKWKHGDIGCVFFPESKIANGELSFFLSVTTSSGCIPGRPGTIHIDAPDKVRAIESYGAYWLEPDGSMIKLEVKKLRGRCLLQEAEGTLLATRS